MNSSQIVCENSLFSDFITFIRKEVQMEVAAMLWLVWESTKFLDFSDFSVVLASNLIKSQVWQI